MTEEYRILKCTIVLLNGYQWSMVEKRDQLSELTLLLSIVSSSFQYFSINDAFSKMSN